MQLRRHWAAGLAAILAVCGLALFALIHIDPIGYYDLSDFKTGGFFGESTSRLRFLDGKVVALYGGGSAGTYLRTNGQWIWKTDTGRELILYPGVFANKCRPVDSAGETVRLRRVLPSRLGSAFNPE